MPPLAVLAILGIFLTLAFLISRLEGLTFLAPKSTRRITGAAQAFCLDQCRTAEGDCPHGMEAEACPMWRFVNADLPTDLRVDPFRELSQIET